MIKEKKKKKFNQRIVLVEFEKSWRDDHEGYSIRKSEALQYRLELAKIPTIDRRRRGKDSNKINWLYARFLSMKYALSPNNRHIT